MSTYILDTYTVLCTQYPELNDVWTTHLLSFIQPSALRMRKHMAITLDEMILRMSFYTRNQPCSMLHFHEKYRSFWLNENVVVLVQSFYFTVYHHILHLNNKGRIHCSTCLKGVDMLHIIVSMNDPNIEQYLVSMDDPNTVWYYTRTMEDREWKSMDHLSARMDCVCVKRALLLRSIWNR
jgi:hypothetical protein